MSPLRILIVDDQTDVRRVLQAGIETLGSDYQVYAMPSAEEALLEASRKPIDLLVTDFRLPGMSGSELVSKMKRYCPDMKVFIITGMTDPNVHRQVKEAKPDDFFIKPVPLGDFLAAVSQTLMQVKNKQAQQTLAGSNQGKQADQSLNEILSRLQKKLGAEAVALVKDQGITLTTGKKLPGGIIKSLPAEMTRLLAASDLAQTLGSTPEHSLLYLQGKAKQLIAASNGATQVLIITLNPGSAINFADPALQVIFQALEEIQASDRALKSQPSISKDAQESTARMAAVQPASPQPDVTPLPAKPAPPAESEIAPEELKKAETIFEQISQQRPAPEQVQEFWEAAMEEEEARRLKRPNDINYDEARRLGLTPEEDAD